VASGDACKKKPEEDGVIALGQDKIECVASFCYLGDDRGGGWCG
jgi:hypothetical protein